MSNPESHIRIPSGFKLLHTLKGHQNNVNRIAWSPNGNLIATPSSDKKIGLWNAKSGQLLRMLVGHSSIVRSIAWSPDGKTLASASDDFSIRLWDVATGELKGSLSGHTHAVLCLDWSPDGKTLASGSYDNDMRIWDVETGQSLQVVRSGWVHTLKWAPKGKVLAVGGIDGKLYLWDPSSGKFTRSFPGHTGVIYCIAWAPDGDTIATGSGDKTIRIWDIPKEQQTNILEGCTEKVVRIAFSFDGKLLASKSGDNTIRLWRCDTWERVADLDDAGFLFSGLSFHPKEPLLATLHNNSKSIRIWELNVESFFANEPSISSVHYTNAKVVLIGDTGVGKTGLGLVLTKQPFVATESTHGRHIWTFADCKVDLPGDRVETRETLLWDLAGQPGYRLIHQLHLNEVSVALVIFDTRSETDPFSGVRHWDRALRQAHLLQGDSATPMKKILVAARCDRGSIGVSRTRIEALKQEMGFDAYFETSAKEGWGIAELIEEIDSAIDWEAMPKVSSTELFQSIKNFLVSEKESGHLLSTVNDLYFAFQRSGEIPPQARDLRAQFDTCVGRVESRGLIKRLSFGDLVLLQPEMLDAYASSIVNAAKDEPDGLGSISEEDARLGRFRMPEDERISNKEQEKLLLIATIEDMIRYEIALREQAEEGPLLVFPSQFTREHPEFPDPQGKAAVFVFEGPVLSVYATLAVRLSHSRVFKRKGMWKNAATFSALVGGTCGILLREVKEGTGELTIFYDSSAKEDTRFQFEEYVLSHLQRRALPETIQRRRILACPDCQEIITDKQVTRRLERGHKTMSCPVCDYTIPITGVEEPIESTPDSIINAIDRAANAQRDLDAGLISAAGEMRTQSFRDWAGSSSATLAIVFTDVVSSTMLNDEIGNEAMNTVRRSHFNQARRQLNYYKGYEIKTIGDSFMIAFRTVIEALDFTLSLFTRTGSDRIKIKAGIHVGPVHIEEEDAFGAMVNYASRLLGMAHGPEIWMSSTAKADIDQEKARRHSSLIWIEHPNCELRGFSQTFTLWSVVPPAT